MKSIVKIALGSLVGGWCVYVALAACSSGGAGGGVPSADAHADNCSRYQVAIVDPTDFIKTGESVANRDVFEVPAGWEPYGSYYVDYGGDRLALRRCIP
ncbi:MAG TPA: hypothetical protein PKA88_35065 [Polyangiaceae bacterium]|nr:hypothetical protein [Polyangiaceae bacterium]